MVITKADILSNRITATRPTLKILTTAAQTTLTEEEATADTSEVGVEEVIPREIIDNTRRREIHNSCHLSNAECHLPHTESIISINIGGHALPLGSNNNSSAIALEPLLLLVNTVRDLTATIVRQA